MTESQLNPYELLHVALNPDGTLTRHIELPQIPVTGDVDVDSDQASAHAVLTKDIPLNLEKKTHVRIFRPTKLPSNDSVVAKLPIIMYFHPGAWIQFSPACPMVHMTCTDLATECNALVVSVGVRLAPENRLPAQYDDAEDAVMWLRGQAETAEDEWVHEYGDFSRFYLYGISNGANIVYNTALRLLDMDLRSLKIGGIILNQPMFGGVKRTKEELKHATCPFFPLPAVDLCWELALPIGANRDHPYSNPLMDGPHMQKLKSLGRCLVIGFRGDLMIKRQQAFVQMLVLKGVQVEAHFDTIGFHAIDLVDPRRATAVLNFVKEFVC